ncbi:hypothetical protein SLE2022_118060 [Rubroshorea leprosula]
MGKKISQAPAKISKINIEKKQRVNILIKVLRPMVYITDSSSFKKLVQELSGNGVPVSGQRSTPQIIEQVILVIDFESNEESQAYDPPSLEHFDHLASEYLPINQQEDSLVYGDLESCFQFEVEGHPLRRQRKVSIYDHELSGLI